MVRFQRLLFHYLACLHCLLLPNKKCPGCGGDGLIVQPVHPHPRPHARSIHEVLHQLSQDIDLLALEEEDARTAGDRSLRIALAGRRAGLAQAALRLQTWLHTEQASPMPRGKNGSIQ